MIRIPDEHIAEWARSLSDLCLESRGSRRIEYERLRTYWQRGGLGQGVPRYNAIRPAVERLAPMLYSPRTVTFSLSYDDEMPDEVEAIAAVGRLITRRFHETDADLAFALAVHESLITGDGFVKSLPDGDSFRLDPVPPECIGVYREDVRSLEHQDAIVHVSYPTLESVAEVLRNDPDGEAKIARVSAARDAAIEKGEQFQIVIGTQDPISVGTSAGTGIVTLRGLGSAGSKPRVSSLELVELREIWIKASNVDGEWVTIQMIAPDVIIAGATQFWNALLPHSMPGAPSPLRKMQPFTKVEPFPLDGSAWGFPAIAAAIPQQEMVTERLSHIAHLARRQDRPTTGFVGFMGVTDEMYDKLLTSGGYLEGDNPNAKATQLPSADPAPIYEQVQAHLALIDKAMGFSAVLQGQGESGVRAQGHAETLVRTSGTPLLDAATRVERSAADAAYTSMHVMAAQDGKLHGNGASGPILLSAIPPDYHMEVDARTGSPLFSQAYETMIFELARLGAIGPDDIIRELRVPNERLLLRHAAQRSAEAQKMKIAELEAGKKPATERRR